MLEFTYRYTTEILEEARVYSNHAKNTSNHSKSSSKGIDIDDIKLAVSNYGDRASRKVLSFVSLLTHLIEIYDMLKF